MQSEELRHIFAEPTMLDGIALYPVRMRDYERFIEHAMPLYYAKDHFIDEAKTHPLLELLVFIQEENILRDLALMFSIVTRTEVQFTVIDGTNYGFTNKNKTWIDCGNYEQFRQVIMRQNLLFTPKVYRDTRMQEWMDKVMQARVKNSLKMELHDKLSTVSVFTGKHYWDLAEYTYYQIEQDFQRIMKFKNYDTSVAARCAGSEASVEHFAEHIDLHQSPYDLRSLTRSKDSTQRLNKAIKT